MDHRENYHHRVLGWGKNLCIDQGCLWLGHLEGYLVLHLVGGMVRMKTVSQRGTLHCPQNSKKILLESDQSLSRVRTELCLYWRLLREDKNWTVEVSQVVAKFLVPACYSVVHQHKSDGASVAHT